MKNSRSRRREGESKERKSSRRKWFVCFVCEVGVKERKRKTIAVDDNVGINIARARGTHVRGNNYVQILSYKQNHGW